MLFRLRLFYPPLRTQPLTYLSARKLASVQSQGGHGAAATSPRKLLHDK